MLKKKLDALAWVDVARKRIPSPCFMTDWYDGTTHPVREGYYERHFTDSGNPCNTWSIQYWDGKYWRFKKGGEAHWRQVGDYPAWRGLTREQAKIGAKG